MWRRAGGGRIRRGPAWPTSEEALQSLIADGLRWTGCRVLATSRHRRRCPHCGGLSHHGDGADRGLPDLLARQREWPRGQWAALEVKNAQGRLSPEQRELEAEGGILICRSLEEAESVLHELREVLER